MRILVIGLLLTAAVWADPQVDGIFAQSRKLNPGMNDCTAKIDVEMDTNFGIIHDHPKLQGTYYYKKVDRHQIELPNAPNYIKRHANVFGFSLPQLDRFNAKVIEDGEFEHQAAWKIQLVPKKPHPSITKIELWVNKKNYTVPEYDTYYTEEGKLAVHITYLESQGFWVADRVHADLQMPSIFMDSKADVHYLDYHFNQGLADSIFIDKKKASH